MFRYLSYRTRYGSYVRNEHGIKKFAEMCMGQLISRVTKKSAFYREMNENMLVEKANLRMRSEELYEKSMLDPTEFFSARRRLWANTFIMMIVIVAAVFLNFISVTAFIPGEPAVYGALRWFVAGVMALVLTGTGIIVAERLIESLLSRRAAVNDGVREVGRSVAPLWAVLLVGIEFAILGLSEVRAETLAAGGGSTILYFGFISLTMLLPVIGGAVRWDAMRYIDTYKTTVAHRQIESRLAQIDSILRQNEEFESNFYKLKSLAYWDILNTFKTYKDNYNAKHDLSEDLNGHFSQTYDTFMAEAGRRYQSDIRDITSRSIRKLDRSDKSLSSKLRADNLPMPAAAPGGNSTGAGRGEEYMTLKPIR